MKEYSYPIVEFETRIDREGYIRVPAPLAAGVQKGSKVVVRLTKGTVSRSLLARGISEDDIERMSALQREAREDVLRFLRSEGSLSGNRMFIRRANALMGHAV